MRMHYLWRSVARIFPKPSDLQCIGLCIAIKICVTHPGKPFVTTLQQHSREWKQRKKCVSTRHNMTRCVTWYFSPTLPITKFGKLSDSVSGRKEKRESASFAK